MTLPVGKLPAAILQDLLQRYATPDPRVVVGPSPGEDAAIIEMGDRLLAAKTDPITFATDEIGWYAVHVNANDIVCSGATPRWFLATVLLPERGATREMVEQIFAHMSGACRELDVTLCGGHTEITHGLERPIVVGQMLGEVAPGKHVRTGGAQVGDQLILTKGFAVEGTAIIAREKASELSNEGMAAEIADWAGYLHDPGISVVRDAQLAMEVGGVHALHDPTEGGVATGLHELADAARVGLAIDESQLQVLPACRLLCRRFALNPLGLIASAALLISAAAERAPEIVHRLRSAGVAATVIGEVTPQSQGRIFRRKDGAEQPLPEFARDEIAGLFAADD